jgi:phosphoesterase RecJ-like protein
MSSLAHLTRSLEAEAKSVVPPELLKLLTTAQRVWVVPHERPDADALGAALALQLILAGRGVEVAVVSADLPSQVYDVIPTIGRVVTEPPAWAPDAVVLVDCADPRRAGRIGVLIDALPATTPRALIDHHVSNNATWPISWIDASAAATCELVTLLAVALGTELDKVDGLPATLAAGLIMDTATFQHGNTTPRTLEVGALLLAAGAPISEISRRIYRTKPLSQLQLHAAVLSSIATSDEGSTIYAVMSERDLTNVHASVEDSEGIVDVLAQAAASDVALFFKEESPTATRLSVRTKGDAPDATAIVATFGGGGHARAAGATIAASLPDATALVLTEVARLRRNGTTRRAE